MLRLLRLIQSFVIGMLLSIPLVYILLYFGIDFSRIWFLVILIFGTSVVYKNANFSDKLNYKNLFVVGLLMAVVMLMLLLIYSTTYVLPSHDSVALPRFSQIIDSGSLLSSVYAKGTSGHSYRRCCTNAASSIW